MYLLPPILLFFKTDIFFAISEASRGCATEAGLCHGQRQYHILFDGRCILLYLDSLLVVLIEGESLHGDYGITVVGFNVIPPQALKILSTPSCSRIGYIGT
jgi:hypothetical protein